MQATTRKPSLFEIGEDFAALEALLADLDGDISDPQAAAAVEAWFAEIEGNLSTKCDAYVWLIRKWESEKAVAAEEAERMQKLGKVRDNRIAALKRRMFEFMDMTQRTKIETEKGRTIAIQNNGGKQPIVYEDDLLGRVLDYATAGDVAIDPVGVIASGEVKTEFAEAVKPFLKATVSLDTEKVRAHLEAGGTLPFAALMPRGRGLRIR